MDEFHLISYLSGICTFIVVSRVLNYFGNKAVKAKYFKPFKPLIGKPKDYFRFHKRNTNLVYIYYGSGKEKYLMLNLDTETIAVMEGSNVLAVRIDSIQKEVSEFYELLVSYFHDEIYKDVTIIDGTTYSNNIAPDVVSTQLIKAVRDSGALDGIVNFKDDSNTEVEMSPKDIQNEVDRILDKISVGGLESLSDDENKFLITYSQ